MPHGSHKLQPLDRCLYSPLKKYSIECDKFMGQHPGRGITQYHVARLFNEEYKKVATLGNAESGFKVTGIYPYAHDLFDEPDFAPSLVTNQMSQDVEMEQPNQPIVVRQPVIEEQNMESNEAVGINPNESQSNDDIKPDRPLFTINQQVHIDASQIEFSRDWRDSSSQSPSLLDTIIARECSNTPTMDNVFNNSVNETQCIPNQTNNGQSVSEPNASNLIEPAVESSAITNSSEGCPGNESTVTNYVSVAQLSPLPHMKEKRHGGRVAMKSQVITASPYRQQLEEKRQQEEQKKKRNKKVPSLSLDLQASTSAVKKKTSAPRRKQKTNLLRRQKQTFFKSKR
jgi:hypothetical protein